MEQPKEEAQQPLIQEDNAPDKKKKKKNKKKKNKAGAGGPDAPNLGTSPSPIRDSRLEPPM